MIHISLELICYSTSYFLKNVENIKKQSMRRFLYAYIKNVFITSI